MSSDSDNTQDLERLLLRFCITLNRLSLASDDVSFYAYIKGSRLLL